MNIAAMVIGTLELKRMLAKATQGGECARCGRLNLAKPTYKDKIGTYYPAYCPCGRLYGWADYNNHS